MKRKIILSLLALFLFSAAGAITATFYIRNTTETLARLIKLHQVEDFRQDLIISIQTVQSELYTIGTVFAHDPNMITDNVSRLERAADTCSNCHVNHSADVITRIGLIQTDIYQLSGSGQQVSDGIGKQDTHQSAETGRGRDRKPAPDADRKNVS